MGSITATSPTEQKMKLKDGRVLGFAEYGDPNGKPVLEFHGWPSSRLEAWGYDEAGKKVGARVIGIDRPGFGLSTFKKGYRIIDWPRDVTEFADGLGLGKFGVAGISSGCPYALACACLIPDRLTACAVVGGLAPLKVPGEKINPEEFCEKSEIQVARLANTVPFVARLALGYFMRAAKKDPEKARQRFLKGLPESDVKVLQDETLKDRFTENAEECARGGMKGPIASVGLELKPWGFRLEDVKMHVGIWQGDEDTLARPAGAAYMASKLPNHTLHTVAGSGHMATIFNETENVLRELLSAK
jgi:pimeloyl-ACP methyl ester carboxylesterase